MLVTRTLCRLLLKVLGVRCVFENPDGRRFTGAEASLQLPNHISYLDAVLVCAYMPAVFVTSRDIERSPVLGHMTRAAGCAFVERFHRRDLLRDVNRLSELLNAGLNVTLFPEGTTSPGDRLVEFKRSLLESAMRSRCSVVPVSIRYEAVDGRPFDDSNRHLVAWYGDMTFFPHLLGLLSTKSVDVRLSALPKVRFRDHKSRHRLAAAVRDRISERFHADG